MFSKGGAKLAHIVSLLGLFAVWLYSYVVWPYIPEQIPAHFGFGGGPTRWVDTSMLRWFLLPIIGVALHVFVYGLARLTSGNPELINFPKDSHYNAFRKMSPEERKPIIEFNQNIMLYYMIFLNFIWLPLQMATFYVATGVWQKMPGYIMIIMLVLALGPLLFIPRYTGELNKLFEEAEREKL